MNPRQLATFPNPELGIVSTVTKVSKGYAVTLIDADAEMIVGVRIFPFPWPTLRDIVIADHASGHQRRVIKLTTA